MTKRIMIVGDPHAHPLYDHDRFEWLGTFIAKVLPDIVVVMGDWGDIPSLNLHGKPIEAEGLRLADDIQAMADSLERLEAPLARYNDVMKVQHRARYRPSKYYVLGNHEARISKYEADRPEIAGMLDDGLGPFQDKGWECVPFKERLTVEGYDFSHFMPSGTMGRPVGGKTGTNLALTLARESLSSKVVGHDHRFGIASSSDGYKRVWGINAGCFVHPRYTAGWCRQTEPMWDRGVLLLDGCRDGDHSSYTWTTQAELQRRYGSCTK